MGGKPVKLFRSLNISEVDQLQSLLMKSSSREALVAYILLSADEGITNLDIAKNAVNKFDITSNKDPIGTTRALVTRVIKDFNDSDSVDFVIHKRGKANLTLQKWSNKKIVENLISLHEELDDFSYQSVKSIRPELISVIENRGNFSKFLELSRIDPVCHLNDFQWESFEDPKIAIQKIIRAIRKKYGIEKLNLHSVEQSTYKDILEIFRSPTAEQCKKCKPKSLQGNAFQMAVRRHYESWEEAVVDALSISKIEFLDQVERKKHKVGWHSYFKDFEQYVTAERSNWNVIDFHKKYPTSHHGLHNNKEDSPFIHQCNFDVMKAAYSQYLFTKSDYDDTELFWNDFSTVISKNFKTKRFTSPRARLRGYEFQYLFLEMLQDSSPSLIKDKDFLYEKSIDINICESYGHVERCRPDFQFDGFWLDTKTTLTSSDRVYNQIQRYLTHTDKLLIVTLKQDTHPAFFNDNRVKIINIYNLIEHSVSIMGIQIPKIWVDKFQSWEKSLNTE